MTYGLLINNTDGYELLSTERQTYSARWVRNVTATEIGSGVGPRMASSDASFVVPGAVHAIRKAADPPGVLNMMSTTNPAFLNAGTLRFGSTYYVYVPNTGETYTMAALTTDIVRSSENSGLLVFNSSGDLAFDSGGIFFSGLFRALITTTVSTPAQTFSYSVPGIPTDRYLWAVVSGGFRAGTSRTNTRLKYINGVSFSNGTLQVRINDVFGGSTDNYSSTVNLSVIIGVMS